MIRVLAYAKKPVGVVMMRPILKRMLADPRFAVRGAAKLFGREARGMFAGAGLPDVAYVPGFMARLRSFDVYLSADFGVLVPRSRLKVHVFHGVSFRNHAVHRNALRYDLLLLPGPYMKRRFEAMGLLNEENADRFRVVGMPKLDALVDGSLRRDEELVRRGLDPSLPTVLWAPTYVKRFSSLARHGEEITEQLLRFPGNVLVKLHDNSLDPRKARRDWGAWFEGVRGDRFRFVREPDVVPLMAAADVLVSDASSVANEYALLDRPILFLDIEDLEDKVKAKADLETWGRNAGDVVPRPADLLASIERALAEPGRHAPVRRAMAADLFHAPGNATANALAAIDAALSLRRIT